MGLDEAELLGVAPRLVDRNSKNSLASPAKQYGAQMPATDFLADERGTHPDHLGELTGGQGGATRRGQILQPSVVLQGLRSGPAASGTRFRPLLSGIGCIHARLTH